MFDTVFFDNPAHILSLTKFAKAPSTSKNYNLTPVGNFIYFYIFFQSLSRDKIVTNEKNLGSWEI